MPNNYITSFIIYVISIIVIIIIIIIITVILENQMGGEFQGI